MSEYATPRRAPSNDHHGADLSATVEDVWALWTTEPGIESWWGPDGFDVTVGHLDLRAAASCSTP